MKWPQVCVKQLENSSEKDNKVATKHIFIHRERVRMSVTQWEHVIIYGGVCVYHAMC